MPFGTKNDCYISENDASPSKRSERLRSLHWRCDYLQHNMGGQTLGHHQERIYYKSDVTFVFTLLLYKNKSVCAVAVCSVYF